ncbi:hypothetical protein FPQ18DRAFT_307532 [Pyronema domesticum]|nr:hypothetical protein FPQ18DRAFT_307532 [Pyronema domesticum]
MNPFKYSGRPIPKFPHFAGELVAIKQEPLDEDDDQLDDGLTVQKDAEALAAVKQEQQETNALPPILYESHNAGIFSSSALGPQVSPVQVPALPEVQEPKASGESGAGAYVLPQWTAINKPRPTLTGPSASAVVTARPSVPTVPAKRAPAKKPSRARVDAVGISRPAPATGYQSSPPSQQRQEVPVPGSSVAPTPMEVQTAPQQEAKPTRASKRPRGPSIDDDASEPAPKKPAKKSSFGEMIAKQYREGERYDYWDW